MNFKVGKPFYVVVILLLIILCLSLPSKIVVTPSPLSTEILYSPVVETPEIYNEITVLPGEQNIEILFTYEQRYTEELVNLVMRNKEFPYAVKSITPVYQGNGVWLVTVDFNSFEVKSKQYIFDEVNP